MSLPLGKSRQSYAKLVEAVGCSNEFCHLCSEYCPPNSEDREQEAPRTTATGSRELAADSRRKGAFSIPNSAVLVHGSSGKAAGNHLMGKRFLAIHDFLAMIFSDHRANAGQACLDGVSRLQSCEERKENGALTLAVSAQLEHFSQ
jgi:hypothetical protein